MVFFGLKQLFLLFLEQVELLLHVKTGQVGRVECCLAIFKDRTLFQTFRACKVRPLLQLIWLKGYNGVVALFEVAVVFVIMLNPVSVPKFGIGFVALALKSLLHPCEHLLTWSFLGEFVEEIIARLCAKVFWHEVHHSF